MNINLGLPGVDGDGNNMLQGDGESDSGNRVGWNHVDYLVILYYYNSV